jgi:hypothetical protein
MLESLVECCERAYNAPQPRSQLLILILVHFSEFLFNFFHFDYIFRFVEHWWSIDYLQYNKEYSSSIPRMFVDSYQSLRFMAHKLQYLKGILAMY